MWFFLNANFSHYFTFFLNKNILRRGKKKITSFLFSEFLIELLLLVARAEMWKTISIQKLIHAPS